MSNYLKWSEVPYAGEQFPPADPVTPLAGSWPLLFLQADKKGNFFNPRGKKLKLPITHPEQIDFERELKIVQRTLTTLTPAQKEIATYYGTGVPTKQWTPVIDRLIDAYNVGPTQAARILSIYHGAINDAMIIAWHLKYDWDVARPDQYDETLETLLCTPRFPTYPSGHAVMSGCSEAVLSYFFPGETRKLRKIANDNAVGRLYAGVHFPSDNDQGVNLGRYIGKVITEDIQKQINSDFRQIDKPYRHFQDADIFPVDFKQFIPYDFDDSCSSLLLSDNAERTGPDYTSSVPKPFLTF
ncbi:vanadium-dependent haloperoxidase [Bacillus sp. SG-1]|uniref:vanadium-dependent haloperoxidase n=1 Tax=Bacillus sp. SG-1 TaxID=161544 RepID=UPI000154438F|nr:vanadium-dependent haloperoxidase [Bacillus sp. SG-1]EDL65434.1 vanadium chloroperoxidase-related protein [Bacillus sp. SG-1]